MNAIVTCERRHGSVMGRRYRLEQVVRSGPDRCEHRAHDELLRRAVTAVIAAPATSDPLPWEVTLPVSARLDHGPGLAEVYDGGGEDGLLYLVVSRPEGTCLADDLAHGALPVAGVRTMGAQIARALLPVHRAGCAHGGLGAELIVRGPAGVAVAGLGIDEWLHRWAHHRPVPPHPAPEQLETDASVSPATDVYALGRLLATAAGRLPRSEPLRAVLEAMTAEDPAARPSTAEVVGLLVGTAVLPGGDRRVPPTRRFLAGKLITLAVAGATALGGLVVHTAASTGFPGGATLGLLSPARPGTVASSPVLPPAPAGAQERARRPDEPSSPSPILPTSPAAVALTSGFGVHPPYRPAVTITPTRTSDPRGSTTRPRPSSTAVSTSPRPPTTAAATSGPRPGGGEPR